MNALISILLNRGVHACQVTSFVSDSLQRYGLYTARLLCPSDSPGKNTGVGCHALHQGIFLTQGLNPCLSCLLHWQVGSLPLAPTWLFYLRHFIAFPSQKSIKPLKNPLVVHNLDLTRTFELLSEIDFLRKEG